MAKKIRSQNFFTTITTTAIPASGGFTVTLGTPVLEDRGYVIFDYNNVSLREVVYYTSKSGNTITVLAEGRTTPQAHAISASVQINSVSEFQNYLSDIASSFGYIEKTGGLTVQVWGGYVTVNNTSALILDTNFTLPASQTTYIWFDPTTNAFIQTLNIGTITGSRIATVITGASTISSIAQEVSSFGMVAGVDNDTIEYDAITKKIKIKRVPASLVDISLNSLSDVTITTPTTGQALLYTGAEWINSSLPASGNMFKSDNLSGLTNYSTARSNLGLGNVDNTSDASKPVSTAQATAIGLKANIASPTFTGTVTVPTPTNSTDASTKGYVDTAVATKKTDSMSTSRILGRTTAGTGAIEEIALTTTGTSGAATLSGGVLNIPQYSGGGSTTWGSITGTLSSQTDLQNALNLKANLASPTFTGTVTLPAGQVVNGVTLTTGGATTDFLRADGTYAAPAGGGGGSPFATDIIVNGQTVGKGAGNIATNTVHGVSALSANTTGYQNTAIGVSALQTNDTGLVNTAIGYSALKNNQVGGANTAIGNNSLSTNTNGFGNTAIGNNSLLFNASGNDNAATGGSSLASNTTGSRNTANGASSLLLNNTGDNNTSTGFESLRNNTGGGNNTAMGTNSLRSNTTGNFNTASGDASLYSNTTGSANTAFGVGSLASHTTGNFNTAIGNVSGSTLTTGSNNTFLGKSADTSLATVTNSTAIGNGAVVSSDNQVVIGNGSVTQTTLRGAVTATSFNGVALTTGGSSSNFLKEDGTYGPASGGGGSPFASDIIVNGQTVGRGSGNTGSAPGTNVAHGVSALLSNTTGYYNTAVGTESLKLNTTGILNSAYGVFALQANTTGDYNVAVGGQSLNSNTSGSYNVSTGRSSLASNTTGFRNTASGFAAGQSITTGDSSTFIGSLADTSLATVTNSTAIGNGAVVSADNQVVIGNASVTDTVLRGAVTATSFNGVALTTGGGTTNFLRADGTYAAPGGGGGGTVTNVSSATAELTVATPTTTPVITIVSAPKLTTARNINGVAFDGTGNITVADSTKQPLDAGLTSISALTGSGYVKATATDTFTQVSTIPNTDITGLGTLATQSGTFSGTSSGTNTGDNAVNSLYSGLVSNATHTGDATGSTALTLATVNSNVGSFGLASSVAQFVVNAKGLITSAANTAIAIASTAITDFASASRAQTEAELVAGTNITITPSGTGATRQLTIASSGGGGGSLTTQDEGTTLSTAVTTLNFTGAGVTASGAGATTTINIPGAVGGNAGYEKFTSSGQTVFTLTSFTYTPADKGLSVYVNGLRQTLTTDYTETSSTVVTFTSTVTSGNVVEFVYAVGVGATGPAGPGNQIIETEIDFGTTAVKGKKFTITNGSITSTSKIVVSPSGNVATGRVGDDWEWDSIALSAKAGTGTFVVTAKASGKIRGKRKIYYSFI